MRTGDRTVQEWGRLVSGPLVAGVQEVHANPGIHPNLRAALNVQIPAMQEELKRRGRCILGDAPGWLPGFGELHNGSGLIARLYDHHSVIESYSGERFRVGDRVAVIPNNANSAMALARSVWMTEDGDTADELRPQPDR